jgi:hypothetical protein
MNLLRSVNPIYVLVILFVGMVVGNLVHIAELGFPMTTQDEPVTQSTEPPVPDEMLLPAVDVPELVNPQDYVVRVTNYRTKKVQGYGVSVTYEGTPLVLSSKMIFDEGIGGIMVYEMAAWSVGTDEIYKAIALGVFTVGNTLPAIELTQQDCAGTVTIVTNETMSAKLLRATNPAGSPRGSAKDWFILSGVTKPCAGAPVFINESLVGVVVGRNANREGEVIMMGTETLIKLAKGATK